MFAKVLRLPLRMRHAQVGRRITSKLVRVRVASRWTNPEPPAALVPRVKAPFAIVHGTDDRFIPVRDAGELHDAATSPCRIEIVAGLGHAFEPPSIDAVRRGVNWALDVRGGRTKR